MRLGYSIAAMSEPATETIYALATPPGVSAIAVIRISGPHAAAAVSALTRRRLPAPRVATRRQIVDPKSDAAFDDALVLWFPAPNSFTGEDVAEIQLHGSRATSRAAFSALGQVPGLRLARAGEFARRAFLHGKLDLAQIEALADLIDAETSQQAQQALRQLSGGLGVACESWRQRIMRARAHAEAEIDFPDEDIPGGLIRALGPELVDITNEIEKLLGDHRKGERLRDGFSIAILGPPNAGKSSLLNAIAGREAAIVSAMAGTTRDVIEVGMDLGGWPVTLADTAGLRELNDPQASGHAEIEIEGMRRTRQRASTSDLRLVVLPADSGPAALEDPALREIIDQTALIVWNKIDLVPGFVPPVPSPGCQAIAICATDGSGLEKLMTILETRAKAALESSTSEAIMITRARHREILTIARDGLRRARGMEEAEFIAEELRLAAESIGRITGRSGVEDMLDVLFSSFCIGK